MTTQSDSGQSSRFRLSSAKRAKLDEELNEAREIVRKRKKPAFETKIRKRAPKVAPIYAYDLETTNIAAGTPEPLYLTVYGADIELAAELTSLADLRRELVDKILVSRFHGARFVAWNANRFDAFFIAAALLDDERFVLRPYLTRSKSLRGLRVTLREDGDKRTGRSWEFLDGIAMLGLTGTKLEKLLETFAPDHRKLTGVINFRKGERFNPRNPKHCAYALRDSVGLYHAMQRAQSIMLQTFGEPLGVTMGGACIKIFQAHIPNNVCISPMKPEADDLVRDYVMRGGYCHLMRRYRGPVWKYDVNQAYAAAMRDAALPCGAMLHCAGVPDMRGVFMVRITAENPENKIPFYCRTAEGVRVRSIFATHRIPETWITSSEYRQLKAEGWQIKCIDYWQWSHSFDMRAYVDKLERLRTNCDGGPKGAIGTMIKATGNHSYGKTVESLDPVDFLFAKVQPDGYQPYFGDELRPDPLEHIYYRIDTDRRAKAHHQPQIGAFITAHVRMQIRRAALIEPDHFLYADTDCVVFSCDVTDRMDIDTARYGAWKIEESGTDYDLIAKKVYRELGDGPTTRSAKGLHVDELSNEDFDKWSRGEAPAQSQIQLQNFLVVMRGADMYRKQRRQGTRVEANSGDF